MATDLIDGPTMLAAPIVDTQSDASHGQVCDGDSQVLSVESSAEPPTTKRIAKVRLTPKAGYRRRAKLDAKEADVTSSDAITEHAADHEQHRAEAPTSFADEDEMGVATKKHKNKERKPGLLQRVRALLMPKASRLEKDDGTKEVDVSTYVDAEEDAHIAVDSAQHEETVLIEKATVQTDVSPTAEQHTANNNVEETSATFHSEEQDADGHSDFGDATYNAAHDDSQQVIDGSQLEGDEDGMQITASGHVTTSNHAVNVDETPISA